MLRALEGKEATLGALHSSTLTSVSNLAGLLQAQGKLDAAEPLRRRVVEGFAATLGADHRDTVYMNGYLGSLLMLLPGQEADGTAMVRDALATLSSPPHSLPPAHPWIKKFSALLD